jgi:uncharacterized protein (DUF2147 family)
MVKLVSSLVLICSIGIAAPASDQSSPVGRWKTLDDQSKKPRGIVEIYEKNGQVFGRIESSFDPSETHERCTKCTDDRKDQLFIGMEIMRHLKKTGTHEYTGGQILEPETGKIYHCKIKVHDQGRKLTLRGYIGVPMLGRSQTWQREP